jgi:glucose-1-phosphate thymidylyltransferase
LLDVEIAKALILAGRTPYDQPWPSIGPGPKQLVPVANQPILFHNLEALRRARLLEATIALEPASARPIMAAVGDGSRWGLTISYVRWLPKSGITGAIEAAGDSIAGEPVLVEAADALHREQIQPYIATFADSRLDAMALALEGGPRGGDDEPPVGTYLFSERAITILRDQPAAAANPIAGVRDHGGHVRTHTIDGVLACHGGQDRLLEGNRRMLEGLRGNVGNDAFPTCKFQGPVLVDPTARLENSLVRGPAIIGPRTRIVHSYVGPYTSIGADVTIEGTELEYSIVFEGAELRHIGAHLETSVIGRGARIGRSFELPTAMRLSIGDGAVVTLS